LAYILVFHQNVNCRTFFQLLQNYILMGTTNSSNHFQCNVSNSGLPLLHFWEHTVGSCHATMALRADWQKQLTRCKKELGFKHVRFHGLLSDDMGTLVCEIEQDVYSFFNIDQIFDFLLSINMRPFVELSFMPTSLSSGNDNVFKYKGNITPPKNYDAWALLITKLVQHWIARYGLAEVSQWFFEVWNEPNLDAFWKGTQADYFKLYAFTAKAIKAISQNLKVGGPATAKNEWIDEFLEFCKKNDVPADFISTHHYPTDAFGQPGDDTITQLSKSKRSILLDQVREVKRQSQDKPVYYTEWNISSNPFDNLHDEPYAAAYIVKTVMEAHGLLEAYSFWTFSDIFEENYFSSVPFHGGFGLMNIYGIPKPSYRAFELLHNLGDELLTVEGLHDTVDVWVSRDKEKIKILISNGTLPRHSINTENVTISLSGLNKIRSAYEERIDENSANSRQTWENIGKPEPLTNKMVEQLEMESVLIKKQIGFNLKNNSIDIETTLLPNSVTCITLVLEH
jgi:xylan 1,4-beta-xylosidase